jgi:hypothetical protein
MIALLAVTSISCSNNDDEPTPAPVNPVVVNPPAPTPTPTTGGYISAKVNGQAFFADRVGYFSGVKVGLTGIRISGVVDNSVGTALNQQGLILNLQNITTTGTYNLPNSNTFESNIQPVYNTIVGSAAVNYGFGNLCATTGTITITVLTAAKIEGTFSFVGANGDCSVTKNITEGSFRGVF